MTSLLLVFVALPAAFAFAAAYGLSLRFGEAMQLAIFVGGPIVLFIALEAVLSIWGIDKGCTEECWGRLLYYVAWIAASVGAEVGMLAGWGHAAIRRRAA